LFSAGNPCLHSSILPFDPRTSYSKSRDNFLFLRKLRHHESSLAFCGSLHEVPSREFEWIYIPLSSADKQNTTIKYTPHLI
jgi:hypothetical protein